MPQVDPTDVSSGLYGLSQTPPDFSPDPVISPGVGGPFSDANLLPGATAGLGSFDGGSLEGSPWASTSAAGLTDSGFGNYLYHQYLNTGMPNVSFNPTWSTPTTSLLSLPGSGQMNLGFGPGHVSQLSPR